MKIVPVNCNGCGAPLDAGEDTRFVTCSFCNTRLEIVRSASSTHTRVLEKLQQQTERITESLDAIRVQNELELLDREWAMERQQYLITDKHGHQHEPSSNSVGAIIGCVFGILWTVAAAAMMSGVGSRGMGPPGAFVILFPLFGVVVTVGSFISAVTGKQKAVALQAAREAYQERRTKLLNKMYARSP